MGNLREKAINLHYRSRCRLFLGACSFGASASKHGAKAASLAKHVTHAIMNQETATGTFKGLRGHVMTGAGSIIRIGKSWAVNLGCDFTFDGALD
jgi:hypothetical protein